MKTANFKMFRVHVQLKVMNKLGKCRTSWASVSKHTLFNLFLAYVRVYDATYKAYINIHEMDRF